MYWIGGEIQKVISRDIKEHGRNDRDTLVLVYRRKDDDIPSNWTLILRINKEIFQLCFVKCNFVQYSNY